MAKIVLSDRTMSQLAAKEFSHIIADIESENLVKEGCKINDLIDEYKSQKQNYEVHQRRFYQKPVD